MKPKVLFLCTGNSCRSQMAEGWARHLKAATLDACSAGLEARGLDPRAVRVMAEAGVDISRQRSKTLEDLREVAFDLVVTVCGHAHESCPAWLGKAGRVVHVGFDDPPALARAAASEAEALACYRRVRDAIRAFVESLPDDISTFEPPGAPAAVQARFDQAAAQWDSNPTRVALARGIVQAIRDAVPLRRDMQALDFGAGTGLITLGLLPHVARLTAVDASREMLKVLEAKLRALGVDTVTPLHCDVAAAALPPAAFDLVASSMVLHHIEDVAGLLRRLKPCLRPGGWVALADLDAEDGSFHPDPTGVFHRGFARPQIMAWLREAGFADVAVRDAWRVARPGPDGRLRDYPVFLATGRAGA